MNAHTPISEADFTNAIAEAAGDFASGIEFGSDALATTDMDFTNHKACVKNARSAMQKMLDGLTAEKREAEQRIAAANARCEQRQKAAHAAYESERQAALAEQIAELTDAEADLDQIEAVRESIDLAVGRLNKAKG